jgi:hypothetical protein
MSDGREERRERELRKEQEKQKDRTDQLDHEAPDHSEPERGGS